MKNAIVLLLIIIQINCTSKTETYTIAEINGIRHIHNRAPAWGENCRLDLELIGKFGELDSDNESLQLYRPTDLVVDSKGDLYILDAGNFQVKKFSSTGEFLFSFGSKGQGPGEFQTPFGMEIDEQDNIYIADYANNVIHMFDSRGELIRGIKSEKSLMPQSILFLSRGRLSVKYQGFSNPEEEEKDKLVKIVNFSGEIVGEFGDRRSYDDQMMRMIGNEVFFTADSEKNIYIARMTRNLIEKFNISGQLIWRMDRVKPYEESETSQSQKVTNPDGRTFYFFRTNRFSFWVQSDHEDRLWVSSQEREYTDAEWERGGHSEENIRIFEIFSKDGVLLGILKKDFYSVGRLFKIIGDRFFLIDAREEHSVFEYRIIDK